MTRKKPSPIAAPDEVLAFFTGVMRGQCPGEDAPRVSEMCKAAELLAKHHRLFEEEEERRPDSSTALAIRSAMAAMRNTDAE